MMPNHSPPRRSPLNSSRPALMLSSRTGEFGRVQSARSLTTPRRSAIERAQAQGNAMKVYVRVRPFSERELSLNMSMHSTVRIDVENPCLITLLDPQKDFRPRETFSFTRCLWSVLERDGTDNKTADDIFDSINMNIRSNTASARGPRSRAVSLTGHRSARERGSNEASAVFEGTGSNAAIVERSTVAHPPYSSQEDVFNEVGRPVLENTLEGYNGCVFAYGQTGSGKTFTMLGYTPKSSDINAGSRRHSTTYLDEYDDNDYGEDAKPLLNSVPPAYFHHLSFPSSQSSPKDVFDPQVGTQGLTDNHSLDIVDTTYLDPNELQGIIPRISMHLFKGLHEKREKDPSHSYRVEVEYYEIYNEKVFDLIRPQKDADLKIRHNPVSGPYVEGLTTKVVSNEIQVAKIIRKGSIERHTAATKINDRSSRSHAIITFKIVQLYLDESDSTCKKQSKLNLVDLAGSERIGAVGAEGMQFIEGTKINLSLTTLGRIIDCLADLSQSKSLSVPVPYRDSNLTWLLMDSLGGNSKTSMVATISPHCINFDEMRQTVRYASRAKQIVNKAVINDDPQVRQIKALESEVQRLKAIIHDADYNEFSRDDVLELQRHSAILERRCHEQEKRIVELRAELEEHGIGLRTDDARMATAKYGRSGQPMETNLRRCVGPIEEETNVLLLRAYLADARAEIEELQRQLLEKGQDKKLESSGDSTQAVTLNVRIQNLKKEINKLQMNDVKKQRHMDRFVFFYLDLTFGIMHNTMVRKEEIFVKQVSHSIIAKNNQTSGNIRQVQKAHRDVIEQMRKQHVKEMEELQKLSNVRLKDSIEKSSDLYQQLIDKHMEKLKHIEERMKKDKEFYDSEQNRLTNEKETLRVNYENQLTKIRADHQQETRKLREQITSGALGHQRSEEVFKRMQDDYENRIYQLQEEMSRLRREKDQETSRLHQQIEKERLRRESDLLEKDRQYRLMENKINDMQRELIKAQTERNKMGQQHHTEVKNLTQQQEKLVTVSNRLISDWDNRSSALEASFNHLRSLLQNQDYLNFRARIRDMTFERKDYTAELEAVEERKQRDTQFLRDILHQLRQNQEGSMASIRRFEEDVMKHLAHTGKGQQNNDNNTGVANISSSNSSLSTGAEHLA